MQRSFAYFVLGKIGVFPLWKKASVVKFVTPLHGVDCYI